MAQWLWGTVAAKGNHYNDVMMSALASQITSFTVVYSTGYSAANQRKHQSSASLAFVREIQRGPVNSPHKWPVTRKMLPFDDVAIDNTVTHTFVVNKIKYILAIGYTQNNTLAVHQLWPVMNTKCVMIYIWTKAPWLTVTASIQYLMNQL